jgi:aminoglycoside phosphotransferase (APT) family kinase protein
VSGLRPEEPPGAVRAADAFDTAAAARWLAEAAPGLGVLGSPEVRQFGGGSSNLTYLLRFPGRELVLRRPPAGTRTGTAHDMAREYHLQRRLRPHFPYVPEVHALCEDEAVIGSPFYVMERVDGVIPRARMPAEIGSAPERMAALGERFVALFAELHAIEVTATGLADLGRGPGYVERQVTQWSQRLRRAQTADLPGFEEVIGWLESRRPPDSAPCVIHNDLRLDNIVLDRADPLVVNGVLDWELATVGDPLMDLGSSLAYWIERDDGPLSRRFKLQPTDLPGFPTRAQVVRRYGELTGRDVDGWTFYEVFGLFRVAVIAQQIYRRFRDGKSANPAFGDFGVWVDAAHQRCLALIADAG